MKFISYMLQAPHLNCMKYSWLIFFTLFCFMLYEQGIDKRNQELKTLEEQKSFLLAQKENALDLNKKLLLQINSESDPAWIELVLIQGLGVIPEDQTKVFFPAS